MEDIQIALHNIMKRTVSVAWYEIYTASVHASRFVTVGFCIYRSSALVHSRICCAAVSRLVQTSPAALSKASGDYRETNTIQQRGMNFERVQPTANLG